MHGRTEYPSLDVATRLAQQGDDSIEEALGLCSRCRLDEARPAPFARVTVKRKLRNSEHCAAHVAQTSVHCAILIVEDPQPSNFCRDHSSVWFSVIVRNADEREKSVFDRTCDVAVDLDASTGNSLNDGSH
jgi:hypothetical protein